MILLNLIGGFLIGFGLASILDEDAVGIVYMAVGAVMLVVYYV